MGNEYTNKTTISNECKCVRNIGIDILRLMLMVMIVIHHCIVHGLNLLSLNEGNDPTISYAFYLLNSFCIIGVNGFFWISGFNRINFRPIKFRNLYFECVFYALILSIAIYAAGVRTISQSPILFIKELFYILCPLFDYWYIAAYLALSVFSPLINKGFEYTSKKEDLILFVGLITVNTLFGFMFGFIGVGNGHTLLQGVFMYCIGVLSCKYYMKILERIRRHWFIISYLLLSLIVGLAAIACVKSAFFNLSWIMFAYNNPLIVCSSVALCFWFSSMKVKDWKWIKTISKVGANCLAAYLITDYTKVRSVIFIPIISMFISSDIVNIIMIITYAICLVFLCYFIDRLRIYVLSKLCKLKNENSN